MSFKPIDPKRDEIRRYLERGNVMDSLTKLFVRLIKERPENPMEFVQNNIGVVRHQHDKYERLQKDLQKANEEIQRLQDIINNINPLVLQNNPYATQPDFVDKEIGGVEENSKNDQTDELKLENQIASESAKKEEQSYDIPIVSDEVNLKPLAKNDSTEIIDEK